MINLTKEESKQDCDAIDDSCITITPIDDTTESFQNVLFISDKKMSRKIEDHLVDYRALTLFKTRTFTNRSLDSLFESGVKHIYCDVSEDACREYLSVHLSKNTKYSVVVIYEKTKKAKFILDIKGICERSKQEIIVCRYKDLSSLEYISFGDFREGLEGGLDRIHSPPNWLQSILSCGSLIESSIKKK